MVEKEAGRKKVLSSAMLALIGTILIRGFAGSGINMSASLFLAPVSQELGVGVGTLSIFFSIASVVTMLWLPMAGKIMHKYPIRITVAIAAVLQTLSFASLGLFDNVIFWYIMTIPQTLGAVILVNLLGPIIIHRSFPGKTSIALGIQMAIVWIFAAVLQPAVSFVIENYGWRNGYFLMGLSAFFVIMISALTLIKNIPSNESPPDSEPKTENVIKNTDSSPIRSLSFYMLLVFVIALTGVAVFTQHIPTYGRMLGFSSETIGFAVAFSSVGSAIGAFAIGFISQKIGGLKTCFGIIAVWISATLGFLFCNQSFIIFGVSCFLHGIACSSIAVLTPILTILFYGEDRYEKIYAKVAMGAPIASILLIPLYGFVYDAFHSYVPVLVGLFALLIVSGASIYFGFRKRRSEVSSRAR